MWKATWLKKNKANKENEIDQRNKYMFIIFHKRKCISRVTSWNQLLTATIAVALSYPVPAEAKHTPEAKSDML